MAHLESHQTVAFTSAKSHENLRFVVKLAARIKVKKLEGHISTQVYLLMAD